MANVVSGPVSRRVSASSDRFRRQRIARRHSRHLRRVCRRRVWLCQLGVADPAGQGAPGPRSVAAGFRAARARRRVRDLAPAGRTDSGPVRLPAHGDGHGRARRCGACRGGGRLSERGRARGGRALLLGRGRRHVGRGDERAGRRRRASARALDHAPLPCRVQPGHGRRGPRRGGDGRPGRLGDRPPRDRRGDRGRRRAVDGARLRPGLCAGARHGPPVLPAPASTSRPARGSRSPPGASRAPS